jgi:hypothetical protein
MDDGVEHLSFFGNTIYRKFVIVWSLAFASVIFLFNTQLVFSQGTGDIIGTVTDNSGSVVSGARVAVKNLGTNLSRLNLTGDRARVDAQLQVGEISQSVSLEAQAVALQTDSSTVGGLITNRAVQDLPMDGRNFVRLVQLAPGANESIQNAGAGGTRVDDRRQTNAVSANGQLDSSNNYLLDGMDNVDRNIGTIVVKPSIDALQEIKVDTSFYPAEVGRAGGAVVNMIAKAGTNSFHGTLFRVFPKRQAECQREIQFALKLTC